ncbi:uncharacterized protein UTRI_02043 [Ustilago trichophora]|uniref:Uncharacterized protein n=1 Tax=Ustilago trichophora TaxID=86804 RepID=A0A5C3DYY7_9BASI|nr:uncharacterized protein UTRI_02043 [Ustilago trichophora]
MRLRREREREAHRPGASPTVLAVLYSHAKHEARRGQKAEEGAAKPEKVERKCGGFSSLEMQSCHSRAQQSTAEHSRAQHRAALCDTLKKWFYRENYEKKWQDRGENVQADLSETRHAKAVLLLRPSRARRIKLKV